MSKNHFILAALFIFSLSACQSAPAIPTLTVQASPSPTQTVTPTFLPASPTVTHSQSATATPASTSAGMSRAAFVFVSETIPDGSSYPPGQKFRKTWTLRNGGSLPWKDYQLIVSSSVPAGQNLGSPAALPLPREVEAGQTVEIAVDLTAPEQNGLYTVYYQLADQNGAPVHNTQIWVSIRVGIAAAVDAAGISASLRGASYEGAEFSVDFCMQLPDERQWFPWNGSLTVNGRQISATGARTDPVGATTANKCFSFDFPASIAPGTPYSLSIGKVELPPEIHQDENCARAQTTLRAAYPGLDFACGGPGFWYTHLVLPPGMSEQQADTLILEVMSSTVYGPWELSGIAP